jgi:PAS domain S-box-containing protein
MQDDLEQQHQKSDSGLDGVRALLSAIVDSSDVAIVSKTLESIITSWNPAAEIMFGYTADEVIGRSIRLIIPEERQAEEDFVLDRIRRGERVEHFETVRVAKDGRKLDISLTISPIRNAQGVIVGASKIARDISEKKILERDREVARQELAETLASRDEFIAVAAHELRNPLNVLALLLKLLERMPGLAAGSPQVKNLVDKSRAQLGRLSSLLDRLLDVTRVRAGIFELYQEPFDLTSLVGEVVGRFTIENPDLQISFEPAAPIQGNWDRLRLDQAVTNLMSNAIKYGLGKPVMVKTSVIGDRAVVTVQDQGPGIPPKDLDRIFDRFDRGMIRSRDGGLGIGLWITHQILDAHGGAVHAESAVGKGSTFKLELPLTSRNLDSK